jgi:hypothetical protein
MQQTIHELIPFYQALSHDKVIRLVEKNVDVSQFIIMQDKYYKIYIPKSITKPVPCLCAHTDTVHLHRPAKIRIANRKLSAREGLGGDDRNGCWLIHQMMLKRSQDFIFALFDMEEHNCLGSQSFSTTLIHDQVSLFIGLDRKGSNEFALYGYDNPGLLDILISVEGYQLDYGTMTDVAILAENSGLCCFNISVGFYNQHTPKEYTHIGHLLKAERLLMTLPQALWNQQFYSEMYYFYEDDPFYNQTRHPKLNEEERWKILTR